MSDIVAVRGDTEKYDLTIVDHDGDPVPLAGAELWFTAKFSQKHPDSMALVLKTIGDGITVTDSPGGEAQIVVLPVDTLNVPAPADLYYDVQLKQADGTVTTVVQGTWSVTNDVTRTES